MEAADRDPMNVDQQIHTDPAMVEAVDDTKIKNARGRLTAFGRRKSLQIGIDGIENLKDPVAIIQDLMTALHMGREAAIKEYERAETEFKLRYRPFTREQCDAAVQKALRDVLTDESASPGARVSAAKEFKKLYDLEDFGDDDESRCRHYESLWSRKIRAASKISTEAMVEIRDYVDSDCLRVGLDKPWWMTERNGAQPPFQESENECGI